MNHTGTEAPRKRGETVPRHARVLFFLFVVVLSVPLGLFGSILRADEPPLKNRPARFSGAVGTFRVTTEASPTTLRPDEALTLTVRVTAVGPVREPPRRPDLREAPGFAERFHIETLSEPEGRHPDEKTWEFVYRLKPRAATVDAVPSLPFVFYKPGATPAARGAYQTVYAERIPLTVKPADQSPAAAGPPAVAVPESAYEIVEGPAVLRRPPAWSIPGPVVVALVLAGAPLVCAGWYLAWRRLYPDAARLARQRQSQAARHALRALHALRRQPPDEQAPQAAAALAGYLRERVDLAVTEPTPEEAAAPLHAAGCSERLAGEVAQFFRDCDAARFAPDPAPGALPWADAAARLVQEVEAELWPAQPS
jgi:hypothetical protein